MKKLLIAVMALTMTFSFAACGKEESKEDSSEKTTTTAAEKEDKDSSKEEDKKDDEKEEEAKEAEKEVESAVEEAETTTTTTAATEEASADTQDTTESGATPSITPDATGAKVFTYEADSSKWNVAEDSYGNTTITYIGTDVAGAAQLCTILINGEEAADLPNYKMEELAPIFKDAMGLGGSLEITSEEAGTFNGYESYTYHGKLAMESISFDLDIIIARQDSKLLVVCPMSYSDATASIQGEFKSVLDTIKIK